MPGREHLPLDICSPQLGVQLNTYSHLALKFHLKNLQIYRCIMS